MKAYRKDMWLQTWTCRLCGGVIHQSLVINVGTTNVRAAGHMLKHHFNELVEVTTQEEERLTAECASAYNARGIGNDTMLRRLQNDSTAHPPGETGR